VTAGQIIIVPPRVVHAFHNSGAGPLRQYNIHCNRSIASTWLDGTPINTDGMDERHVTNRPWASAMPIVLTMHALRSGGGSYELEGCAHGDIAASLIFVDGPPGSGPRLHRHPYAEIFVIEEGQATFTVGDQTLDAHASQIVIAPANAAHAFINSGAGPLRQLDIHCHERFVTEWLA
jgi:mannose-6-phosphate isomerase-like protein (cupin superfamily)